ncbi:MAG: ABC transporter ATP-binding protein [Clostridia bacterium]|nr:ABC transporter ATP-binding protein [Clostridia bacterium]
MKRMPLLWIVKRIRRRIPMLLALVAAQVGNALFTVLFALGTRGVIDSATAGNMDAFWRACLYQAAIILAILVSMTVSRHLREKLRADLDLDWKKRLLHGLLHGEYEQVRKYHSAELLNRLNNDVSKVDEGVISVLPSVAAMVTKLVAAVVVLGTIDARFTGLLALLGIAVVAVTGLMRRCLKELNKRVSEQDGKVSAFLQEMMEKLLMVQAMDVSQEVERRADGLLKQRYAIQRKRKNVGVVVNTGVSVMAYGVGFMALVWCAYRMLQGQMTFGSLTAVTQLVSQLQTPFVNLSGVMPQYVAMVAAAERLMELDAIQGEPASVVEDARGLYAELNALGAQKLTFAYDSDEILQEADFELPRGAFAVITGPSGVGKSTLLKLLLGVYQPDGGVMYASRGGERIPLGRATRRLFAYVPQGNLILSGTLRENLTIVNPGATQAEIDNAVYISAMDEYLPQLPQGLETELGENGAGLSEGQAQRLAIARAVLSGAPILLLDECTSALDESLEQTVLTRLKALSGRSCIAVTHRPAALALCDWRLVIAGGKIQTIRQRA